MCRLAWLSPHGQAQGVACLRLPFLQALSSIALERAPPFFPMVRVRLRLRVSQRLHN